MSTTAVKNRSSSAFALTLASCISFVPIGIATVLLGPMLPTLSARWSLNYSQAGALFTAQYVASTCAVAVSGVVVAFRGYRFAIQAGLLLMAAGLAFLLQGSALFGIICIGIYGAGLGIAVPAANLLVAVVNPERRSASLNWLNFCWSAGAVSCPFLIALASRTQHLPLMLRSVAVFSVCVALGIGFMAGDTAEPHRQSEAQPKIVSLVRGRLPIFLVLAAVFFLYVGTENAFGGWVASYAKSLGQTQLSMSLMTPSFFYAALMIGRLVAPFLLKRINDIRLAEFGVLFACTGAAGLVLSHGLTGVLVSASVTGLGLSSVYPITISLLSREFGASSSHLGSFMFVLSNIGGGLLPWIVGVSATEFGTLNAGLFVPLIGCAAMFSLFLVGWSRPTRLRED